MLDRSYKSHLAEVIKAILELLNSVGNLVYLYNSSALNKHNSYSGIISNKSIFIKDMIALEQANAFHQLDQNSFFHRKETACVFMMLFNISVLRMTVLNLQI